MNLSQWPPAALLFRGCDAYARIGLRQLPRSERSRRYAFNLLCLFAAVAAVLYGLFYAAYGGSSYWILWITSGVIAQVWTIPYLARWNEFWAVIFGLSLVASGFAVLSYHTGAGSGLFLLVLLSTINVMILRAVKHPLQSGGLCALTVCCMIAFLLLFPEPSGVVPVDDRFLQITFVLVLISMGAILFVTLYALIHQVATAEEALAAEHARSEALLDNLLPTDIAARLKSAPGEIIADDLPAVTILFADIVDFTPRASSMPPEDVVRFLNRVFTEFDRLTHRFGLEKIKTIGDAYMVAAGMPLAREDHVQAVADMALEMIAVTQDLTNETGQSIQVRIGLHSGAAIAGVIGTQKVFYDVWGDTVNTASRMESHGGVGRIQLTEETKHLLGDDYVFEARGVVDIKGKGMIKTYWLTGHAPVVNAGGGSAIGQVA